MDRDIEVIIVVSVTAAAVAALWYAVRSHSGRTAREDLVAPAVDSEESSFKTTAEDNEAPKAATHHAIAAAASLLQAGLGEAARSADYLPAELKASTDTQSFRDGVHTAVEVALDQIVETPTQTHSEGTQILSAASPNTPLTDAPPQRPIDAKASDTGSNSKVWPVEDATTNPQPETTSGGVSKGLLDVAAAASSASPGESVLSSRDSGPGAAPAEQTPQPSSVIEVRSRRDEKAVEDSQSAKEEASAPVFPAAGQEWPGTKEAPSEDGTPASGINTRSEIEGGGPCAVPSLSSPPSEGDGVGSGIGVAPEAVETSRITEELVAPVSSEVGEAFAADEQGELAGENRNGTAVINDGAAPGFSTVGLEKAPALESEWEAYSERPSGGQGRPQPSVKSKIGKGSETPLETATTATKSQPPDSEKQPTEPIDISQYNGPGVTFLPDHYLWWNQILLKRFISLATSDDILLATTPRALAAALFDGEDARVSPAEAERRFADAVAAAYKVGVVHSVGRLKVFRRLASSDGIPTCVAFLALSVLAAHKMHMDESTWSNDYYSRLAELLGVEEGTNGQPIGFRADEFESLWLFLADWIFRKTGRSLVLPPHDAWKRFIAYPLAHVPLRQLDLEKLPAFFEWARYSSNNLPSTERLEDDLRRWDQSYGGFSNAGREALNDSRVGAVLAQARSELRAWDGVVSDSTGIRYSQVEILLETIGRRSNLALLAPRREGFPETFSCGDIQLSGGDSWYDPLPLKQEDGALLLEGFSWPAEDRPSFVLRRAPGMVFVLAPHTEYSDLVSRIGLPKDITSAILCHESLLGAVDCYLASICQAPPRHFHDSSLPDGWFLFLGVRAIRRAESVPQELRALEVATEVNIIPSGGLRMGAQWAWMEGAAPRLLIEGHEGQPISVNDMPTNLDEDGYIKAEEALANAGEYTVKIGSFEKRVRILKPKLRPSAAVLPSIEGTHKARHSVIVAAGQWNLIGSLPGDIETIEVRGLGSSLVFCDFAPVWAVKLSTRKTGMRVIELVRKPVEISVPELLKTRAQAIRRMKNRAAAHRWASAIREANCRHPNVECGSGNQHKEPSRSWDEYVRIARLIQRLSRNGML